MQEYQGGGLDSRACCIIRRTLSGYLLVSKPLRKDMRTTSRRVAMDVEAARDAINSHSVVVMKCGLGEMSSPNSAKFERFAITKSLCVSEWAEKLILVFM